jgi:DNA segregation ATPase FtsK/SpoIIIE, S-DNA-T family
MPRKRTYRKRATSARGATPRRVAVYKSTNRKRKKAAMKIKVKKQIAREIWGVGLLVIAAITVLSIQGAFGLVGNIWVQLLKPIIGWGIYIIPVLFAVGGFMIFLAKKITFGASRMFGMFLFLVSILSVLHMSVPIDSILSYAQAGSHGGYIGFVTNFLFRQLLSIGNVGSGVVFVGLFLVSLLLTFESSLRAILKAVTPKITIEIDKSADRVSTAAKSRQHRNLEEEEDQASLMSRLLGKGAKDSVSEEVDAPGLMIKRAIGATETSEGSEEGIEVESKVDPDEEAKKKVAENLAKEKEVAGDETNKSATKDFEEELSEESNKKTLDEDFEWEFPSLDLLNSTIAEIQADDDFLKKSADNIHRKLGQFGIDVTMQEANVGPTVIQYTLKPSEGVKLSKITGLKSDIGMALAAKAIRIEAPIPGKSLVGIEIPNDHRANVHLREIVESDAFDIMDSKLRLPLGRDVSGNPIVADLETMPHLLIAGATGSGKSVCMNAFLMALLYQNTPEELKMILIDPKRVELGPYNGMPYLLTPVIKDPEKAAISLRWVVAEMTRRYQVLSEAKHRNIQEYNLDDDVKVKMPKIVVVIDELADLMMASGKEVEASICRIAQMARAVGIHLIIATQRPSVDVITGLIKANIPARIAFAVSSGIDSRTILDGTGAEDLLGRGDMLYLPSGMGKPFRIQGVFVSSKEIDKVTNKVKLTIEPNYDDTVTSTEIASKKLNGIPDSKGGMPEDAMYEEAYNLVRDTGKASASLLQRRLKLGYARAARLIDILEDKGVVGPADGAKPRKILVE